MFKVGPWIMHSEDFISVCSVITGQELVEQAHAQSGKIHHCQATL